MLSRTADHLYWMSRYMERAENISRFIDAANRQALSSNQADESAWNTVLTISGGTDDYLERHGKISPTGVVSYSVIDAGNSSSIYSSLRAARENAHAVRAVIPNELWESINATWLEVRGLDGPRLREIGLTNFCDWVKQRSHLFRGATYGTMLRDEAFHFTRLGTFLERADDTARLLSVRAEGVTADTEVKDATDQLHCAVVLRSVSAFKAFRSLYREDPTPALVAEMLILRDTMPRSLHACLDQVVRILETLSPGRECTRLAGEMHAQLHWGRLDKLLAKGLDVFLEDFLIRNNGLGGQVHADFMMAS